MKKFSPEDTYVHLLVQTTRRQRGTVLSDPKQKSFIKEHTDRLE